MVEIVVQLWLLFIGRIVIDNYLIITQLYEQSNAYFLVQHTELSLAHCDVSGIQKITFKPFTGQPAAEKIKRTGD